MKRKICVVTGSRADYGLLKFFIKSISKIFPELTTIPLKGYRIRYPKSGALLIPRLLLQIPKILKTIKLENEWLKESFARENWDLVISDNRYGLYHPKTKCIFLTHQLWVLSGWGNQIDQLLNKRLHQWISNFNQCWKVQWRMVYS